MKHHHKLLAYYAQLVGKTIREIQFAIVFTDGTKAWLASDPECNGLGFPKK